MKNFAVLFGLVFAAGSTFAQQSSTTVQMQCHDLASAGNFLGPDETLVNGMACRLVKPAVAPAAAQAAVANPAAAPATAQAPVANPAPAASTMSPQSGVTATPVAPATPISMKIIPGSKVYIAPMEGFESYLVAALGKKKVQLVPVSDQSLADYVISGTSVDKKAGWAKIVFMGNVHSDNAASITMTDRRSGAIVYAYAVDKKSTMHGQQTTAEACAKHLEAHIEGHD
jgi:hypothetical protein